MEPVKFRSKKGPEDKIQDDFIKYLKLRGWWVERMIGVGAQGGENNRGQQIGIPDIYIMHPKHGQRWIDLKNPGKYEFTKAQRWKWPIWEQFGCPLWIIVAATDEEYDKLFQPPNWRQYWKPKYDEEMQDLKDTLEFLYDEYQDDNS